MSRSRFLIGQNKWPFKNVTLINYNPFEEKDTYLGPITRLPENLRRGWNSISGIRKTFLFSFLLIFVGRFVFDPTFHLLDYALDGSYQYALPQLWLNKMFSGVNFFFTYGPLAQYLDSFTESGTGPNVVKIFFELFIILSVTRLVFDFSAYFGSKPPLVQAMLYAFTLALLYYYPYLACSHSLFYDLLIVFVYLAYYMKASEGDLSNIYIYILLSLAVLLTQFKFSLGIHALIILFIATAFLYAQGISKRFLAKIWFAWVFGSLACFYLFTKSMNFILFFKMGLNCSSDYSEIMGLSFMNGPMSSVLASEGFFYTLSLFCLSILFAKLYIRKNGHMFFFVLCFSASLFCLFKRSLVRMDIHTYEYYMTSFPLAFFFAGFVLNKSLLRQKESWVTCAFLLISLLMFNSTSEIFSRGNLIESSIETIRQSTVERFQKISSMLRESEKLVDAFKEQRFKSLNTSFPSLQKALERIDNESQGKRTLTIGFYPWSMMLACLVPQYRLVTTPSLQIYFNSTNQELGRKDRDYLCSETRPDVLVLGAETLDGRDSLSEFNFWLEPLLKYYEPYGTFDQQTVLVSRAAPRDGFIKYSSHGPGCFLKLQMEHLDFFRGLLFSLSKLVYKAPQLTVHIELEEPNGEKHLLLKRAFYSQLKSGIFFSGFPIGSLLEEQTNMALTKLRYGRVTNAEVDCEETSSLFPVFPPATPLKISYCVPMNYQKP